VLLLHAVCRRHQRFVGPFRVIVGLIARRARGNCEVWWARGHVRAERSLLGSSLQSQILFSLVDHGRGLPEMREADASPPLGVTRVRASPPASTSASNKRVATSSWSPLPASISGNRPIANFGASLTPAGIRCMVRRPSRRAGRVELLYHPWFFLMWLRAGQVRTPPTLRRARDLKAVASSNALSGEAAGVRLSWDPPRMPDQLIRPPQPAARQAPPRRTRKSNGGGEGHQVLRSTPMCSRCSSNCGE
jgi:hypothetical protein